MTLLSNKVEIRATCYEVNTLSGGLSTSRPGGALWPKVENPHLRLVLSYTSDYTDDARAKMKERLKVSWSPTDADTSHATLKAVGGRDYASNGYGIQRKDFGT